MKELSMKQYASTISAAITLLAFILLFSFLFSYPLMMLWNLCLVPAVTGLNTVGWAQMWGISILTGIMFKTNVTKS
jgi:hypothetical protein